MVPIFDCFSARTWDCSSSPSSRPQLYYYLAEPPLLLLLFLRTKGQLRNMNMSTNFRATKWDQNYKRESDRCSESIKKFMFFVSAFKTTNWTNFCPKCEQYTSTYCHFRSIVHNNLLWMKRFPNNWGINLITIIPNLSSLSALMTATITRASDYSSWSCGARVVGDGCAG